MPKDSNSTQAEFSFIRPSSKRSQTFIPSSSNLFNFVPTIRPKNTAVLFSPLLLFSSFSDDPNLEDEAYRGNLPFLAVTNDIFNETKNTISTLSNSQPTCLTPQLKKRNSILQRLKKKKELTSA